jgi:hypothetical protein
VDVTSTVRMVAARPEAASQPPAEEIAPTASTKVAPVAAAEPKQMAARNRFAVAAVLAVLAGAIAWFSCAPGL